MMDVAFGYVLGRLLCKVLPVVFAIVVAIWIFS